MHRVPRASKVHAFVAENEGPRTAGPSLAILQRLEVRLWKVGDSHYPAVELAVGERLERCGGLLGFGHDRPFGSFDRSLSQSNLIVGALKLAILAFQISLSNRPVLEVALGLGVLCIFRKRLTRLE